MDRGRTRKVVAVDRQKEHAYLENVVDKRAYERFKKPAYCKTTMKEREDNEV